MATDVSTSFPEIVLPPGATITVDTKNASAIITKLNIYGVSPVNTPDGTVTEFVPTFVYSNAAG